MSKCRESGRPRVLSTFSATALSFPVERLVQYATWKRLQEMLHSGLVRTGLEHRAAEAEALAFLNQHELNEAGLQNNQVQDRLLQVVQKGRRQSLLSRYTADASDARRSNAKVYETLAALEAGLARDLAGIESDVQANQAAYLGDKSTPPPIRAWLEAAVATWAESRGFEGARSILGEIVAAARAYRLELQQEGRDWDEKGAKDSDQKVADARKSLEKVPGFLHPWVKTDDQRRALLIDRFNAKITSMVRRPARVAGATVLEELEKEASALLGRIGSFLAACSQVDLDLAAWINRSDNEVRREPSDFVVEMDVVDPGFLSEFYRQNRTTVPDTGALAWLAGKTGRTSQEFALSLVRLDATKLLVALGRPVMDTFRAIAYSQLNVVDHVSGQLGRGGPAKVKLQALFQFCEPMWTTRRPTTDTLYDEILALGCDFGGHRGTPPPDVVKWVEDYSPAHETYGQLTPEFVATGTPYEVELVRYTHGARAYYLRDAAEWRALYRRAREAREYPLHLYAEPKSLPDLFPDLAGKARQLFALGCALGFIMQKGDWYYFNLVPASIMAGKVHEKAPHDAESVQFVVPYETQATTLFGEPGGLAALTACRSVLFLFDKGAVKTRIAEKLDQGRLKAFDAFVQRPMLAEAIEQALSLYKGDVGNRSFKEQLSAYHARLLTTEYSEGLEEFMAAERDVLAEYLSDLEVH